MGCCRMTSAIALVGAWQFRAVAAKLQNIVVNIALVLVVVVVQVVVVVVPVAEF